MAAVKEASLEDLRALSWLPDDVALAVYGKIHGERVGRGSPGERAAQGAGRERARSASGPWAQCGTRRERRSLVGVPKVRQ